VYGGVEEKVMGVAAMGTGAYGRVVMLTAKMKRHAIISIHYMSLSERAN